ILDGGMAIGNRVHRQAIRGFLSLHPYPVGAASRVSEVAFSGPPRYARAFLCYLNLEFLHVGEVFHALPRMDRLDLDDSQRIDGPARPAVDADHRVAVAA